MNELLEQKSNENQVCQVLKSLGKESFFDRQHVMDVLKLPAESLDLKQLQNSYILDTFKAKIVSERLVSDQLLTCFLKESLQNKSKQLENIQKEISTLKTDLSHVNEVQTLCADLANSNTEIVSFYL